MGLNAYFTYDVVGFMGSGSHKWKTVRMHPTLQRFNPLLFTILSGNKAMSAFEIGARIGVTNDEGVLVLDSHLLALYSPILALDSHLLTLDSHLLALDSHLLALTNSDNHLFLVSYFVYCHTSHRKSPVSK
jgi:hypothetical protein